jgi:AcrR family transcriptional regulator
MVDDPRPYHHGDLRSALVETGLRLARTGGVNALGLREVTRVVGVTPNAAYRHFADQRALVIAIALQVQDRLAGAMVEVTRAVPAGADPAERAIERLRGVGLGYIHFAVSEPGWFELAFLTQDEPHCHRPSATVEGQIPPPYQLLLDALDDMLRAGVLTSEQRLNAEWDCWSAVHGFADLATRGPLKTLNRTTIDTLAAHAVDTVIRGIRT